MKSFAGRLLALFSLLTLEVALVGGMFLLSALLFFYLTRVVFVQHSVAFDAWAFGQMDVLRAAWPGLTTLVYGLTFFASLPFLVGAGVGIPVVLRGRGHKREGLEVFLAVAGAALLNQLLKTHFQRVRPASALIFQQGLSFPSGHAMIGLALYGCLAWLLWRHRRHPIWAALLLLFAMLIGLTRVYLHVHYATDVLAGFAAGLLWLILLRTALLLWWRGKAGSEEARR
ncbi:undecaprenyl-diphosphatase [Hymenobacter luteus]|uniref:Undecaprenyl-diphosphatase n=2 Tax=Hymenobacter TaxID=89966 RepID=A0A7W9WC20_9BACT|nr:MULTISPECIES: phosphatase PAP2 family protein [Hymenobacter]MBB4600778.1 undecaprenyl-diphosphatase [Hymenobacter latericoloratus]MBB6059015.1 undecaprenyl-diphosphatase [Hymenobacter luteus]